MQRLPRWVVGPSLVATIVCLVWVAVVVWLPSDDDLAVRLAAEINGRLGVKVSIGSVHLSLWPKPFLVLKDVRTLQAQPVHIQQLTAYPSVRGLLDRKLVFERVAIETAVFPRNSVRALERTFSAWDGTVNDEVPLGHLTFRNLTWISYSGIALAYDGEIDFDPHWRPQRAELRRPGTTPAFALTLTRQAQADRWQASIDVGGGSALGELELKTTANGTLHLSGQVAPHDIEVASALATFDRRAPIEGKASGKTVLFAEGQSLGELTRSLHSRTQFSVKSARLLRFDLRKAIRTGGKEHQGQTDLQELTGQLDTQNGDEGTRVMLTNTRARSGEFTATGKAVVYHGAIEASGNLDVLEGAIGVPFRLSGPVDKPQFAVPPGFFAGAAIGTAVLPGIGTVIGARIGGALGHIFGADEQPAVIPKKSTNPK